jgi:hypothetical protein
LQNTATLLHTPVARMGVRRRPGVREGAEWHDKEYRTTVARRTATRKRAEAGALENTRLTSVLQMYELCRVFVQSGSRRSAIVNRKIF